MKHSTMYLFNRPRSAYEPHITVLASRRIADGRVLMKQIARQKEFVLKQSEMDELIARYEAVEESVKHWRKILNEE